MNGGEVVEWVSNCTDIVLALALIGVGAALVRPAKAASGWLVLAAGVVQLLTVCCFYGLGKAVDRIGAGDPTTSLILFRGLGLVMMVANSGLLIAAVAMLPATRPAGASTDSRPPMA